MFKALRSIVAGCVLLLPLALNGQSRAPAAYDDLVALFNDWRAFAAPKLVAGVPDYSVPTMAAQLRGLGEFQERLGAIDTRGWPKAQQIDYELVRAEMNGMAFDHRVLRPWSRNPCFYTVLHDGDTDVPAREGPPHVAAIELWTYSFPARADRVQALRAALRVIPRYLEHAKRNLTEEARDLYFLGARVKQQESAMLDALSHTVKPHHPELLPDIAQARMAIDDFRAWLESRQKPMTKSSGVGVEEYNWYLANVHYVPYTWEDQVAMMRRELARAWANLKLEEQRNRALPPLRLAATKEEAHARFRDAVADFIGFLKRQEIFTVPDYAQAALEAREGGFVPPDRPREFFTHVDSRDAHPMRGHGTHWIDRERMTRQPHPSPIRRVPLLYNIWDTRAEGLATGFEEVIMSAGYLDDRPRARELVYILVAQRAARALGDLMMHANRWSLEQAVDFAVANTPRGWLSKDGETVWGEQQLYLEQPSYGTSYMTGKIQIEDLMAAKARQLGERFTVRQFFDEFHDAGMVPVSLIRKQMVED